MVMFCLFQKSVSSVTVAVLWINIPTLLVCLLFFLFAERSFGGGLWITNLSSFGKRLASFPWSWEKIVDSEEARGRGIAWQRWCMAQSNAYHYMGFSLSILTNTLLVFPLSAQSKKELRVWHGNLHRAKGSVFRRMLAIELFKIQRGCKGREAVQRGCRKQAATCHMFSRNQTALTVLKDNCSL